MALLLVLGCVAFGGGVGGLFFYRVFPETAIPLMGRIYPFVHRPLAPIQSALLSRTRTSPSVPPLTSEQSNTDNFRVVRNVGGLTGTVLLLLRSNAAAFQDRAVEIDRDGVVRWEFRNPPNVRMKLDVRKLPNGQVLLAQSPVRQDQADDLPPWGPSLSRLMKVDSHGEVVYQQDVLETHHAEELPSGNFLLVDANTNTVREVAPDGRLVWSWSALDHIVPYNAGTFKGYLPADRLAGQLRNMYAESGEGRNPAVPDWTHMNSAQRLSNGDTVISLRNQDLVIEVDPQGNPVWTYGPLILKHQHCAWVIDNGNLLVTDNGNGRIIEVDRTTQKIVWQYDDGLLIPAQGCAYRLPNGDTLITDSYHKRVLEVNHEKEVVWEVVADIPGLGPLYRAWWSPS